MQPTQRLERKYLLLALGLMLLVGVASLPLRVFGAPEPTAMQIDATGAGPRTVEDSTVASVQRDYAAAWKALATATAENRAELLGGNFVGEAREQALQLLQEQGKSGLRRKTIDRGHKVQVVFYSLDGSAILLHDTAQQEVQLLDGSNVVHSEEVTLHYLALLTPAENSWKVRVLESVPGF